MLPPFLQPLSSTSTSSIYQNAQFEHKNLLGSSHAIWWPPRQAETPDLTVLFIPGNPGLVDLYIPFLSAIYEKQISRNIAILAHAHLDHAPHILGNSRSYPPSHSLTVQIESSIENPGFYPLQLCRKDENCCHWPQRRGLDIFAVTQSSL